jgi:hypothetical protein
MATGGSTRCDGCHTVPNIYSEAVGFFLFLPRSTVADDGRGKEVRRIPVHLERRVKIAWGNFEATRRHVQAYMVSPSIRNSGPI